MGRLSMLGGGLSNVGEGLNEGGFGRTSDEIRILTIRLHAKNGADAPLVGQNNQTMTHVASQGCDAATGDGGLSSDIGESSN
jgi:hypothetical protein